MKEINENRVIKTKNLRDLIPYDSIYLLHFSEKAINGDFKLSNFGQFINYVGPAIYTYGLSDRQSFKNICHNTTKSYYLNVYEVKTSEVIEPISLDYENWSNNTSLSREEANDFLVKSTTLREWYEVGKPFLEGRSLEEVIRKPLIVDMQEILEKVSEDEDTKRLKGMKGVVLGEAYSQTWGFPYPVYAIVNQCCLLHPTEVERILKRFCDAGFKWVDTFTTYAHGVYVGYDKRIRPVEIINCTGKSPDEIFDALTSKDLVSTVMQETSEFGGL